MTEITKTRTVFQCDFCGKERECIAPLDNESVWLKRCLACGERNQPLAIECEHCKYDKFVWDDRDRPSHIQLDDSMKPVCMSGYEFGFETQVELSIRGIYPFCYPGTTTWWPFVEVPRYYKKVKTDDL